MVFTIRKVIWNRTWKNLGRLAGRQARPGMPGPAGGRGGGGVLRVPKRMQALAQTECQLPSLLGRLWCVNQGRPCYLVAQGISMWQVSPGPVRDSISMKSSKACPSGRDPAPHRQAFYSPIFCRSSGPKEAGSNSRTVLITYVPSGLVMYTAQSVPNWKKEQHCERGQGTEGNGRCGFESDSTIFYLMVLCASVPLLVHRA